MAHLIIHQEREEVFGKLRTQDNAYISGSDAVVIWKIGDINLPIIFRPQSTGILVRADNFPVFIEEKFIENVLFEVAKMFEHVQFFNFSGFR